MFVRRLLRRRNRVTDAAESKARVGFARSAARRVLKKKGVTSPGTPIAEIVVDLGYRLLELDWPQGASGILLEEKKVIAVNANHAAVRRRFSAAHELGHICLNHDLWFDDNHLVSIDSPPIGGFEGRPPVPEREADIFAAELLMPLAVLKRVATRGTRPQELAQAFEVSEEAMFHSLTTHRLLGKL